MASAASISNGGAPNVIDRKGTCFSQQRAVRPEPPVPQGLHVVFFGVPSSIVSLRLWCHKKTLVDAGADSLKRMGVECSKRTHVKSMPWMKDKPAT